LNLEYKRFPRIEYEKRWERARKLIADNGLDALLITESNNYTYFSGGHGDFSFSRPTVMVLPKEKDPVVMIHDLFDASQHRESWVEDIRSYTSISGFPVELLKNVCSDLGIN
jgi:Xaa-Pro aminopeptidase